MRVWEQCPRVRQKGHEIRNGNRLNKKYIKRVNECVSNNFGIGNNNNVAPLFCQN